MSEIDLSFELDGQPQDCNVDGNRSALSLLREDLDQSTLRPGATFTTSVFVCHICLLCIL